jgi:Dynamin family
MSSPPTGPAISTGARYELVARAEAVRAKVRKEAAGHGRDDLVTILDSIPEITADRPIRVIVAGSLKRGKSTLVNTLVGRPLLSPVGVDVTTACWLEIGYGEEQATALIANAWSPGEPIRRPIAITEVERYVALDCVTEPVLGVEVRVESPLLTNLTLVDTPGVGGLDTGHSQTTLTALQQADALLFVSDCTQPILVPEIDFLASAAERVATVIVAVTKSDTPGCGVVVRETCERLALRRELAEIPVFAVSPPLADQAHEIENDKLAAQLTELSGLAPLIAALRERTAVGRDALRIANCAQTTASVAKILARRLDEQAADPLGTGGRTKRLEVEEARLSAVITDQSMLSVLISGHLAQLRTEPREKFTASATSLCAQYQDEAQRGPAAQLATLAARMTADLTAAGVASLDLAMTQAGQMVRTILDQAGASELATDLFTSKPAGFDLGLAEPESQRPVFSRGLAEAGSLFPTLVKLIAGSAVAVSVLTGPGAIAASLALAACAGWWRARSGSEQERRSQLRSWVKSAADQASITFGDEMTRRVGAVQLHLDSVLPGLLDAQRVELARVRRELGEFRAADAEGRRQTYAQLMIARDLLQVLADDAANVARAATTMT